MLPETVTKCFEKVGFSAGEVTASVENRNDQQDLSVTAVQILAAP
jgi:hypothetical protein